MWQVDTHPGSRRALQRRDGPPRRLRTRAAPEHGCGRIHWEGATAHNADDLVAERWDDDDTSDATHVLAQIIADGPCPVSDIIKEMGRAGFSVDQAKRAKKRLRMLSGKVGAPGEPQHWEWLPADQGHQDPHNSAVV